MNKYEQFDASMIQLKKIEQQLNTLTTNADVSLSQIMKLKDEATTHYKNCNDVLKEIKDTSNKQSTTNE